MASEVFFTDMHVAMGDSLLKKFDRLITRAGIDTIDFKDKYVAVKLHFGEVGNMAFLRQQYARVLCDHIKKRGGKPFLTDANTLYVGYRSNALDHLDAAYINGYSPLSTGVHTIIADGLRGTDERHIPVEGGVYVKEAKIGAAIAEADILISLTHSKGHVNAGYGGCLKNIGMGSGSKAGKMEMHMNGTPIINSEVCIGCGMCVRNCAHEGVSLQLNPSTGKRIAIVDENNCVGCGYCIAYCPKGAIDPKWNDARSVMNCKIAEYVKAAINGKPSFHINMLMNVSPECDCDSCNDIPIIPDVGMFASFDPVAIDKATVDAANAQPVIPSSVAGRTEPVDNGKGVFGRIHPDSDWETGFKHAEMLGLGTREYILKKI